MTERHVSQPTSHPASTAVMQIDATWVRARASRPVASVCVLRDLADYSGRKQCGKITQFAETAM